MARAFLNSIDRKDLIGSEKVLDGYVGEYQLSPTFMIVVFREGNRMFAEATMQPRFEIFPEKEDEFFLKATEASLTFTKDESGKVNGLILRQGAANTPGKKVKWDMEQF